MNRLAIAFTVVATLAGSAAPGNAQARAPAPDLSLVISTAGLASSLGDPAIVVLQVDATDSAFRAGHIPGAHFLRYGAFIADVNGVSTELPPVDSLRKLLESVGVSTGSHVILTGPPLLVSRAFFTLDYLGLAHVHLLDGGFSAWKKEGRPVEERVGVAVRGHLTPAPHASAVASTQWVEAHLGKPGMSLIDTRREDEYLGTGTAAKGHIAGARRLEWQEMFRDPNEFTLKDVAELQRLWRERVAPGDTVVAYCRVGHRSSATYVVARLLGYPVKLYDGSYEEWTKLGLPLVQTATPLRTP